MKVLVLGGAGHVGWPAAQILATSDLVSEVVVGGRDLERAERAASELGPKASPVAIDATDEQRLASLAADCDLIVNAAGPDFKVPLPAVRAAIAAGVHYCDVGADGAMTEQVLELDVDARAAGVTVIPGIGVAPGLTNLMAVHAARQLEVTEEIQFGYLYSAERHVQELRETGHVSASWETVLKYASGSVRTYREGRWIHVNAFESGVEVILPQTGTPVTAFPVASPEPITLPRHLSEVKTVTSLVGLFPLDLNDLCREQARLIAAGDVEASQAARSLLEAVNNDPDRLLARPEGLPSVPVWLTATGVRQGQRARFACWPTAWWMSTGAVIAVAALNILRGEIGKVGVLPPEACFEPLSFFAEVARYGPEQPPDGNLLGESFEVLD